MAATISVLPPQRFLASLGFNASVYSVRTFLGCFDYIFNVPNGTLTISTPELAHSGQTVPLDEFMGIPILTAQICGRDYRMFFDTGAQISYFQDGALADFPSAGTVTDFYPGVGQFQTDTHHGQATLGGVTFTLRCGKLPGLLCMTLMMADTEGIIGNEMLARSDGWLLSTTPRARAMSVERTPQMNRITSRIWLEDRLMVQISRGLKPSDTTAVLRDTLLETLQLQLQAKLDEM